ncbi:MAG: hypothetical protein OXI37_01845, partial [Gammaproteobacteria bacterium]|nr:hypothetical protein [Gammaproteobacteria bacterium]
CLGLVAAGFLAVARRLVAAFFLTVTFAAEGFLAAEGFFAAVRVLVPDFVAGFLFPVCLGLVAAGFLAVARRLVATFFFATALPADFFPAVRGLILVFFLTAVFFRVTDFFATIDPSSQISRLDTR